MAKSQPDITDRMTNCSVCFEPYEGKGDHAPRLLPCSHTFCERCIRDLLDENVFHCPECKVPHPAENGAKTFKPNKYVLSFMERIAADAEDSKEVTEQLLEKYELVQDIFTQKKRNISELKRKMIDTNKTCKENLEQKRQYFLKKINERFDEMAENIDSSTQDEILIFDKDLENLDKFTEKLESLKIRIENRGKGEKGSCAVDLEQFKNVAELPLNVYHHCEYHPEDQDADFFTRTCGYLSTEQQQYKETQSFALDEMLRCENMCLLSDTDEVCVIQKIDLYDCWRESSCTYRLAKYSLQTGRRVDYVNLNRNPNGMVSVTVAKQSCVALSAYRYSNLFYEDKISFRNACDLRKTVCVFTVPVATYGLWAASSLSLPSLLFYDDHSVIRNVDCRTKPPTPGETVIRTGVEIRDVCFVQHRDKQLILCFNANGIGAYDFRTGEKQWQKRHAANYSMRPGSITTNSHSFVLASSNGKQKQHCIKMLFTDGRFIRTLMNISAPLFLAWIEKTSSVVVVHRKGQQDWFVTVIKVEQFKNLSHEPELI